MSVEAPEFKGEQQEVATMKCKVCRSSNLVKVLSLGNLPLANSLLDSPDQPYETYPLDWMLCTHCSLVQLERTVPPKILFDEYAYLTSCSPPMVSHAKSLVEKTLQRFGLTADSTVVELGSNDGYLLQHYPAWVQVLGWDPSHHAVVEAAKKYIPTIHGFFGLSKVSEVSKRADIIHANNVLAHVPEVCDFACGIRQLLKPDGVAILEVPYICDLIDKTAFDTIYHEHVYYFSLTALVDLFSRCELHVNEVERISTHGGSLRLLVSRKPIVEHSVSSLLAEERPFIYDPAYYLGLSSRIAKLREEVRRALARNKMDGFGASAKATILLNVCGITGEQMEYIADDTPTKQGKFVPGTGIKIIRTAEWLERQPKHTMILCWNFAQELSYRYSKHYQGKFCTPYVLPEENHAHGR